LKRIRPFAPRLRPWIAPRSAALVAAACASPALAQNAFRPLPALPELAAWSGVASSPPAPLAAGTRPAAYFEELERAADAPRERTFLEARGFAELVAGADLEDGAGALATQRAGWTVTFGRELSGERLAALSVSTEATFYDFGDSGDLVPGSGDPFNDLYQARVSGMVRTEDSAAPGWFAGFELALGGEDEASPRKSLQLGAAGGFRYAGSDTLSIEVGLAALSRLEDEPWVWPFLGVEWKASERLSFEARGTQVEARLALDERWSLAGRADYAIRQYRLNDDNPLPEGVLRDEEIRAGLALVREGSDGLSFQLFAGYELWRELSTLDDDGREIAEVEADPAPFAAFALRIEF
jgi:hypothetical protein